MAVIELGAERTWRLPRVHFGAPVLTARRARSWKRWAAGAAMLMLLAGAVDARREWHHAYDQTYAWLALGTYLAIAVVAQVLSVLPTVRSAP